MRGGLEFAASVLGTPQTVTLHVLVVILIALARSRESG